MISYTPIVITVKIFLIWLVISKYMISGIMRSGISGKIIKCICWAAISLFLVGLVAFLFDDGAEDLGGGYSYGYDSSRAIHGPKIDVPPEIIDIKYDRRFIVAKQRLNGLRPQREYYDSYDYNYPSLYGDYYWIIDKREDIFYGPMDSLLYRRKSDSLGISISQMKSSSFLK